MAEVQHSFAGLGQIMRVNLVKPPAVDDHSGLEQHGQMLGRQRGAAPGALGNLGNHERFASAQFLEDVPAHRVADGGNAAAAVWQWQSGTDWLRVCIHGKHDNYRRKRSKDVVLGGIYNRNLPVIGFIFLSGRFNLHLGS